jgi:hypothetical protein
MRKFEDARAGGSRTETESSVFHLSGDGVQVKKETKKDALNARFSLTAEGAPGNGVSGDSKRSCVQNLHKS